MNGNVLPNPFAHFIAGVNYMPREHGCQMWSDWSEAHIDRDFKEIRELGLTTVRTFLFWDVFQPLPDVVSVEAISKFDKMLEIAQKHGIKVIPTFFTGHMSGENFDVTWRGGRDPFANPFVLKSQAELVRFFAKRYAGNEAILCWDLANEQDNMARPRDCYSGWLWTHLLYRELKSFDPTHLVTLGTHITSLEDDKLRLDMITVDFLCAHPYPMYTRLCVDPIDTMRSTLFPSFTSKLSQGLGNKRVMLEELGTTTTMTSEEASARFFRSALYSALINDTIGVLAWCFSDYTIPERVPYKTMPHELNFGLVRQDGSLKKHAITLKSFIDDVAAIDYINLLPEKPRAAIILPRGYYDSPGTPIDDYLRSLFSSYVVAKQANIDVDFIRSQDPFDYDMLILPSTPLKGYLTTADWEEIMTYVAEGGQLYCSYNGLSMPGFDELFGVQVITQRLVSDIEAFYIPDLKGPSTKLLFKTVPAKALCIRAEDANVLAQDMNQMPCVVTHEYGRGTATLVTQPIEYFLSFMQGASQEAYTLYKMAYQGLPSSLLFDSRYVEAKLFHSVDGKYLLFVNFENIAVNFDLKAVFEHRTLQDFISKRSVSPSKVDDTYRVNLEPNGYAIYRAC